jgi:hypothetical protein
MAGKKTLDLRSGYQRHQIFKKRCMENKNTLDEINSAQNINKAISEDEEREGNNDFAGMLMAEDLILQLPKDHEGRKQWLRQFGQSAEAKELRNVIVIASEH